MSERPSPTSDGYGSIRADELMPLREAARRLGFGQKTIRAAQRSGLHTIQFGKMKYVVGSDVIAFFEKLSAAADN